MAAAIRTRIAPESIWVIKSEKFLINPKAMGTMKTRAARTTSRIERMRFLCNR